jgi:transcriptional regulator with XRE-family HTH domain
MRRMMVGMSQEGLGDAVGITFQQVQKYEKGANRIGSSRMVQIANALNTTPAFFFEGAPSLGDGASKKKTDSDLAGPSIVTDFFSLPRASELAKAFAALDTAERNLLVNVAKAFRVSA